MRYQEYKRNADRSRSRSAPIEWFDGQHEALVPQDLFKNAQEARKHRAAHHQATPRYNPYLLRNLVYCYRCCNSASTDNPFPAFGKMRAQAQAKSANQEPRRYYRCRAKDFNRECSQRGVSCEAIDEQVINTLMHLKPSAHWRDQITQAMSDILGERNLEQRLTEIRAAIERMDFRWDQGFITDKADYLEKRIKLQQELEQLSPIPDDDLERAADILSNFGHYWEACGGDFEEQHRLIKLIVERVYVRDEFVVAMTLKADYHVVLGNKANEPTTLSVDSSEYTCGDDGCQDGAGYWLMFHIGKARRWLFRRLLGRAGEGGGQLFRENLIRARIGT